VLFSNNNQEVEMSYLPFGKSRNFAEISLDLIVTVLSLCLFLIYLAVGLLYGPIVTPDGIVLHELSAVMAESSFSSAAFQEKYREISIHHPIEQPIIFYFIYLHVLATLDMVLGDKWPVGHVILNAMTYALAAYYIMKIIATVIGTRVSVLIVATCLATSWEYIQWVSMTQSESLFVLVLSGTLFFISKSIVLKQKSNLILYLLLALVLSLISVLIRPTGIVLLLLTSALCIRGILSIFLTEDSFFLSPRAIVFAAVFIIPIGLLVGAAALHNPIFVPEFARAKFYEYHQFASQGVIIFDRIETNIQPGVTYGHFLYLTAMRLPNYFTFLAEGFSIYHNLLNATFYVPFYVLIIFWPFISKRSRERKEKLLVAILILGTTAYAVFHSVSLIDELLSNLVFGHPNQAAI
jgi:hypothetical protein